MIEIIVFARGANGVREVRVRPPMNFQDTCDALGRGGLVSADERGKVYYPAHSIVEIRLVGKDDEQAVVNSAHEATPV